MVLSNISIKRPVFTVMVTVGLMVLGLMGARSLGVDLFPDVTFPIVVVNTVYPGAGPEEVEQLVTKKVEETVSSINGVDEVRSYSRDSVSTVVIQFKLETDVKAAATDVRDKLAAIRRSLPEDVEDPAVQRFDPSAAAVVTYVVSSNRGPAETRRLVEDEIKPRIEAVDGVAAVNVIGGQEREVHVFVDRERLESLGISIAQIAQMLQAESNDIPGGRIASNTVELSVKTLGRFQSLEELRNLAVSTQSDGSQVRLGDVARVEDAFKDRRTITKLNGREAVAFEVQKQGGSNTVAIADHVYKVIDQLQKELPKDVELAKAIDSSTFIRANVHDVTEAILFGGAMAILVIFLFMLDWRSTLISSLALPTSVVTTFFAMWLMGFTFNMMSLMALSLAIGLLIDDAVVVRENIYRHMEKGEDPVTAAQKGTSEIGLAVMATTFTIVAVFVPVAFTGGIVGKMFKQFGLTVAAAVLVSLFISFTLDPMLSARVVRPIKPGHHEELKHHRIFGPIVRFYDRLDAYYRGILGWSLKHKWAVVIASTLMFVASMGLTAVMGKEFMSAGDRGEFRVLMELPAGTSLAETERVTAQAEALIKQNPEVRTLYTTIGPSEEVNKSVVRVYATKKNERKITQAEIQDDLRQRLSQIPGLSFSLADLGLIEAASQEYPVTLYIRGSDYNELQVAAREFLEKAKQVPGVKDADISFRAGKPELSVKVDRSRAADLGVSAGALGQTVRLALEGDVVAKYRQGDRDYDVRLQLSPEDREAASTVSELIVPATGQRRPSADGAVQMAAMQMAPRQVRVGEVADLSESTTPSTIERMNRQRQIIFTSNVAGRSLGEVVTDLQQVGASIKAQDVRFVFGGQAQRMEETFANLGLALLVAILFIYFVLASQFESFLHPLTIMLALPLAIVGAFLGLFLTGFPIGMPALIGIILLMGLVTKNAILLVDLTNQLREEGKGMLEALLQAGPTRLRPILMTSAAMVLGMLPAALSQGEGSEFRAPMAIAVIGGVLTSTVLTLIVVPVVYTWVDRFTIKGKHLSRQENERAEAAAAAKEEERPLSAAKELPRLAEES